MRSKLQGFTLIELMITVAIVAILAAIAVPNYRNYVMRSQRSAATTALLRIQSAEEKFFLQNNAYTGNLIGAPPAGLGMSNTTDDGRYGLGVALVANGYLATANAAGSQLDDTKCQSFTIDQVGTRRATDGPNGTGNVQTQECWR